MSCTCQCRVLASVVYLLSLISRELFSEHQDRLSRVTLAVSLSHYLVAQTCLNTCLAHNSRSSVEEAGDRQFGYKRNLSMMRTFILRKRLHLGRGCWDFPRQSSGQPQFLDSQTCRARRTLPRIRKKIWQRVAGQRSQRVHRSLLALRHSGGARHDLAELLGDHGLAGLPSK